MSCSFVPTVSKPHCARILSPWHRCNAVHGNYLTGKTVIIWYCKKGERPCKVVRPNSLRLLDWPKPSSHTWQYTIHIVLNPETVPVNIKFILVTKTFVRERCKFERNNLQINQATTFPKRINLCPRTVRMQPARLKHHWANWQAPGQSSAKKLIAEATSHHLKRQHLRLGEVMTSGLT